MKNIIIPVLLVLTLLSGCEKESDLVFPAVKPEITANSFFTTDSLWSIKLAYSKAIRDTNDIKYIDNAVVEIFDNENKLIESLKYFRDGSYKSLVLKPDYGKKYSLKVTMNNEIVLAKSYVPEKPVINNLKLSTGKSIDVRYNKMEDYLFIDFDIVDNPNVDNYYIITFSTISVYGYNGGISRLIQKQGIEENDNVFEQFESRNGFDDRLLFTDKTFNGKTKTLKLKRLINGLNKTNSQNYYYQINLYNCSADMYQYLLSLYYQKSANGFESTNKPIRVVSNMSNGIGIFSGYSSISAKLDADYINSIVE